MMRRTALICGAFVLLAALDIGIPVSMLTGRAAILRNGTEVRLELTTRDPRSLFRGEYSQLAYAIATLSNVPATEAERARCTALTRELPPDCVARPGGALFVVLAKNDNGTWRADQVSLTPPAPGTLFIRGKITYGNYAPRVDPVKCPSGRCFSGQVNYGIESWFGPQGVPAQIDRAARSQLTAVVRIDRDGTAVLADLLLDGRPVGR
jgi:uncharacterized membrane-anchored protein